MSKLYSPTEDGFNVEKTRFDTVEKYEDVKSVLKDKFKNLDDDENCFKITYSSLFIYRNSGDRNSVIDSALFKLGIPAYSIIRFEVKHVGQIERQSFRIGLEVYNRKQESITLTKKIGSFYSDNSGVEYFVSEANIRFLNAWNRFREVTKEPSFAKDLKYRFVEYSKLSAAYDGLEINGTSILDIFKVKVIDSLEYNLVGREDGSLDIEPAFSNEFQRMNSTINKVAETSKGFSDRLNILDRARKKNIAFVFSETAQDAWREFSEIKRLSPAERTVALKSGAFLSAFPPKAIVGDIFSERVAGFVLEEPESNTRENGSDEIWSDGFSDYTSQLLSVSGAGHVVSLIPSPSIYTEIKAKLLQLQKNESSAEDKAKAESGAIHTELVLPEENIYIQELDDSFNIAQLEEFVDRIEKSNKPNLEIADLDMAKALIETSEKTGDLMVSWSDVETGVQSLIPLRSLQISVRDIEKVSADSKNIGVSIVEANSDGINGIVMNPDWHKKYAVDAGESLLKPSTELRAYQVDGFSWLSGIANDPLILAGCGSRGALLADDMGLGKTIQVIRLIASFKANPDRANKPILIVGPLSLLETSWEKDGLRSFLNDAFFDNFEILNLKNIKREISKESLVRQILALEEEITSESGKTLSSATLSVEVASYLEKFSRDIGNSILLCSYETMRSRIFELASVDFSLVVLDEAQKIKNKSAGQSRACKALKADMKVAMTGTPIENSVSDLWNICDYAVKGYIGSSDEFREAYTKPIAQAQPGSTLRKEIANRLENALKPIWLRRTKKDILKNGELPPIVHYDSCLDQNGQIYNKHLVQMSDRQLKIFQSQVGYYNECKNGHRLSAIRNMLEACYAPWWVDGIVCNFGNFDKLTALSPKLKVTFQILDEIASKNEKVIIFANIIELQRELAGLVQQWYHSRYQKSVDCEYFNGELNLKQRSQMLDRFKSAPGFKAIVVSPKSGGAGLNLIEANHVIHYTREWNPALERQATDRAHRLKQTKVVHVYYPTSSLKELGKESAEEHIANILQKKRDDIDDFTISGSTAGGEEAQFGSYSFLAEDSILSVEGIPTLGPARFEKLVSLIYKKLGYQVSVVGGSNDRGCDLVCLSEKRNLLVQVKFTEVSLVQGTAAVNEIRGAKSVYEQKHKRKFELVAATNSTFSTNAHSLAVNGDVVEIVEGNFVTDFLKSNLVRLSELR